MGELNGLQHGVFQDLLGPGFNHHNALGGPHHGNVEHALPQLGIRGVHHKLAFQQAHAHRAHRPQKWKIGEGQRAGGRVDGQDIGVVLGVGGEHQGDHLGFIAEAFGEERADGAVDNAAGQDFALAGPAFALDEAAGNASAGVGVFAVINGKGEKINAFALLRGGAGGA